MPYYLDRQHLDANTYYDYPGLLDMAKQTINTLDKKYGNNEGFFVMVEGSRIDQCGHDNDIACLVNEMIEFENTIDWIMEWANQKQDTLVIVVPDHETGGFSIGRSTSVQASNLRDYLSEQAPIDYNITKYYGSFDYNYLIPPKSSEYGYGYIYDWYPGEIKNCNHTAEWMTQNLIKNDSNLSVIIDSVASSYGFSLTQQEIDLLNSTLFDRDPYFGYANVSNAYVNGWAPVLKQSITMLLSARTLTGWTTHGHSGVDLPLSCNGPQCDLFSGHSHNYDIGTRLFNIFNLYNEKISYTATLQDLFLNNALLICDDTDRLDYEGYSQNVSYPIGNLKNDSLCVTHYI